VSKFTSPQDACKATPLRYRPCPDHPTIRQLDEYKVRAESAEIEEMIRGKKTNLNIRASVSKSDAVALCGDGGALANIRPTVAIALPKEEPEKRNPRTNPKNPRLRRRTELRRQSW
jgi:hypothetical protein